MLSDCMRDIHGCVLESMRNVWLLFSICLCLSVLRTGLAGCTMEEVVAAAKSANAHNFIMGLPKQ